MLKQNQVDVVILDDMFSKRYGLVTLKPFIKTQPKICLNQKCSVIWKAENWLWRAY